MKPMVVGIGGAGGNILKEFLHSHDVQLPVGSFGEHQAFGDVKGIWLDSATQDAQDQNYYKNLEDGRYPGYLICHGFIPDDSDLKKWIMKTYGYDLKAQGYDRRAEYLKGIFEIFELEHVKEMARTEFNKEDNPLPSYMWKVGIRPFTVLGLKAGASFGTVASPAAAEALEEATDNENALQKLIASLGSTISANAKNGGAPCKPEMQSKLCDSILFLASLGGGTGTGFINPITSYVRREQKAFPIFALGILTEKGEDARKAKEGQRNLGAVIAMYDLLTKPAGEGIDAMTVIDNQILKERFGGNFSAMDNAIYRCLKPMLDLRNYPGSKLQDDAPAMKRVFWEADLDDVVTANNGIKFLLPPILVPCYNSQTGRGGGGKSLVENALSESSRLFPCVPSRADRAYVFTRGFVKAEDIASTIEDLTGILRTNVMVYKKMGNGGIEDVLILLRNPYGGVAGEHNKKENGKNLTFESRIYDIVKRAIKYIDQNETNIIDYLGYTDLTKTHLRRYFYGKGGLREELEKSLKRIAEGKKPIFINQLKIFSEARDNIRTEDDDGDEKKSITPEDKIEKMVRREVQRMMASKEFKEKVEEIVRR